MNLDNLKNQFFIMCGPNVIESEEHVLNNIFKLQCQLYI